MASGSPLSSPKAPPRTPSPSLAPPRKSVELEDAGAHDLDSSNDESDQFSDAREALTSPTAVPIPLTRVEKVDDEPSHGQVPGTEAYEKRIQDAVPDEVEVIPDGQPSAPSSRRGSIAPPGGPRFSIPRTVVEKVDDTPSHGEVPGTAAHEMRKTDYVPDHIVTSGRSSPSPSHRGSLSVEAIPKTIVTKVDSEPRHGEVPGRGMTELTSVINPMSFDSQRNTGPIAADGGFGPMDYEGSDESEDEEPPASAKSFSKPQRPHEDMPRGVEDQNATGGDDFDDFEEGAEVDDFGDFGEEVEVDKDDEDEEDAPNDASLPDNPVTTYIPPIAIPDFSDSSLDAIKESLTSHLDALFPATTAPFDDSDSLLSLPSSTSLFLSDRSHSLWSQLVAPPPLQPPNWVRSRIRRLFLVSLGVPVDLDEILPASKQKKLILQYTSTHSAGVTANLRNEAGETPSDSASAAAAGGKSSSSKNKRRKGPSPPPEFDMLVVKSLCATTNEAIEGMDDAELRAHVKNLDALVVRGREVLQYWVARKDAAVSEKEAFDGVIENLVQHIRHTRK